LKKQAKFRGRGARGKDGASLFEPFDHEAALLAHVILEQQRALCRTFAADFDFVLDRDRQPIERTRVPFGVTLFRFGRFVESLFEIAVGERIDARLDLLSTGDQRVQQLHR